MLIIGSNPSLSAWIVATRQQGHGSIPKALFGKS